MRRGLRPIVLTGLLAALGPACALEPTGLVGTDTPKGLVCPSGSGLEAQSFDGLGLGLSRNGRFFARYMRPGRVVLVDRCDGREDVLPTDLLTPVSISEDREWVGPMYQTSEGHVRVGIFSRDGIEVASAPSSVSPGWRLSADGSTLAHLALCNDGFALCPAVLRAGSPSLTSDPPSGGLVHGLVSVATADRVLFVTIDGIWSWEPSSSPRIIAPLTNSFVGLFISGEGSDALVALQRQVEPFDLVLRPLDLETGTLGEPVPGLTHYPHHVRVDDSLRFVQGLVDDGSTGRARAMVLDRQKGESLDLSEAASLPDGHHVSTSVLSGDGAWIALGIFVPSQDSNWGQRIQLIPNPFFAAR